jgi:hypothetical protein
MCLYERERERWAARKTHGHGHGHTRTLAHTRTRPHTPAHTVSASATAAASRGEHTRGVSHGETHEQRAAPDAFANTSGGTCPQSSALILVAGMELEHVVRGDCLLVRVFVLVDEIL